VKSYKEDSRPSFQFYPDDWLSEAGLSLCSLAAQGLWIKMLCFMWKSIPRGYLMVNGKQMNSKDLAKLCGEEEKYINELLLELENNQIFSKDENGIIYSRRMQREEKIRKIRVISGRQGGFTKARKYQKNKDIAKSWQIDSKTNSKSLAKNIAKSWQVAGEEEEEEEGVEVEEEIEVEKEIEVEIESNIARNNIANSKLKKKEKEKKENWFEKIWVLYPNKVGKKEALRHFKTSIKTEEDYKNINIALINYLKSERVVKGFVQNGSTWFNNWQDWINPTKQQLGIKEQEKDNNYFTKGFTQIEEGIKDDYFTRGFEG